jgi:hypothetical protein
MHRKAGAIPAFALLVLKDKKMIVLYVLLFAIVMFSLIDVLVSGSVYGGLIDDSELQEFLVKHRRDWCINEFSVRHGRKMLVHKDFIPGFPYIASHASLFSRWHIEDYGQIPRWSPWSSVLDRHYAKLLEENKNNEAYKKKPLVDL